MIHDELAYVVDDDDRVITIKKRGEVLPSERVRIVSIWLVNTKGEVLIAQRSKSMSLDPGLWGPSAAGGVKVGASYEQAAIEEIKEELGYTAELTDLIPKGKMVYETAQNGKRMCAVFLIKTDWPIEKFKTEPKEVEEIKWIAKTELIDDIKTNPRKYLASAEMWHKYIN
jgi:isopentenyldiphosphate isomerase